MKNPSHKGLGAIKVYSDRKRLVRNKDAEWLPVRYYRVDEALHRAGLSGERG